MSKKERQEIIGKAEKFVGVPKILGPKFEGSRNVFNVRARRIATWRIVCMFESVAEAAAVLNHSERTVRHRVAGYPPATAENLTKYLGAAKGPLTPEGVNKADAKLRGLRTRKKQTTKKKRQKVGNK